MADKLMIFDGDCAFCSSAARLLRRMTRSRIAIRPFQHLELSTYGLTDELTSKAVYYISSDGTYAAARAVARCLIDSGTAWAHAGRLLDFLPFRPIARYAYYVIAKNRHRLPGGTPECSLDS